MSGVYLASTILVDFFIIILFQLLFPLHLIRTTEGQQWSKRGKDTGDRYKILVRDFYFSFSVSLSHTHTFTSYLLRTEYEAALWLK